MGAHDALLLAHDDVSDAILPVSGTRKTLPRGAGWRGLLQALRTPGTLRADVESFSSGDRQPALAHSQSGMALVFVGGAPQEAIFDKLRHAWELLSALLSCEQASRAMAGELNTARSEMRQYAAQAEVLDETRLKLDETVRK
ncbi:MAG: hypothetical protein M3Q51_02600, partial [Pseudomonadota bacterium]|nr:hypothetical protein [Pseudomonadota bacterium]